MGEEVALRGLTTAMSAYEARLIVPSRPLTLANAMTPYPMVPLTTAMMNQSRQSLPCEP